MKYLDEYRNPENAKRCVNAIHTVLTRPWNIMEICGGQTHAIVRYGLQELLPSQLTLIHGPGCPVCVTPIGIIDQAVILAEMPDTILCSFGDMLRVPGSKKDLLSAKASGGDVRIVYSPLDAVRIATQEPAKQVVFFAVGFETTAPANAMAVRQAFERKLKNFSLLVSHVLVPPAMEAILSSPQNRVQGFLAAGHVCTVMGYQEYEPIAARYRVPIVVTGFEPLDILQGIFLCVKQLEERRCLVENQYSRFVRREGNPPAKSLLSQVFEVTHRDWRGIGEIPNSGFRLRKEFESFDAEKRFNLQSVVVKESQECQAGKILQGLLKPNQCSVFGTRCTPETPLGAPMVSSEGACSAYYRYKTTSTVS